MKIVSLLFRIFAIVGAAMALAGVFMTQGKVKEIESGKRQAESSLTQIRGEIGDFEAQIEDLEKAKSSMKSKYDRANSEASKYRGQVSSLEGKARSAQSAKAQIEKQLKNERSKISGLQTRIRNMEANPTVDNSAIEELGTEVSKLKAELKATQGELSRTRNELSVAKAASVQTGPPTLEGAIPASVVAIDRRAGILILDKGRSSDLKKDMEMSLQKDGVKIARLLVSKVGDNQSVTNILPGFSVTKFLRPNDQVQLVP